MSLSSLLSDKRSIILSNWCNAVIAGYPQDTSNFLRKNDNRFANPVGHTINDSFGHILDALLSGAGPEDSVVFLDNIIRIRAVQDFSPSQAVSFMFTLKKVVRDVMVQDKTNVVERDELLLLDEQVDAFALASFEIYMQCREKLYDIKANELKNMTYRLLQKAQKMGIDSSEAAGPSEDVVNIKQEEVTK
ncbi:MAG: RsbRD N-terminal domain-containing protein [Thermodesulfovibrionales bacterium]